MQVVKKKVSLQKLVFIVNIAKKEKLEQKKTR